MRLTKVVNDTKAWVVSMKSGLRDRNNMRLDQLNHPVSDVSMKSGLRDRNNEEQPAILGVEDLLSQ